MPMLRVTSAPTVQPEAEGIHICFESGRHGYKFFLSRHDAGWLAESVRAALSHENCDVVRLRGETG